MKQDILEMIFNELKDIIVSKVKEPPLIYYDRTGQTSYYRESTRAIIITHNNKHNYTHPHILLIKDNNLILSQFSTIDHKDQAWDLSDPNFSIEEISKVIIELIK